MTETPTYQGRSDQPTWPAPPGSSGAVGAEPASVPFLQTLALGVLTILFGAALLIWPDISVRLLGVLVGIWLLLAGVARILGAFLSWRGLGWQLLSGVVGVLLLAGGVACLRDVAKGVTVLAFLIALAWISIGLAELVAAAQTSGGARVWWAVLGVGTIVIGFVFLLWPEPSLKAMVLLAGITSLLVGIGEVAFAVQLRRVRTRP
jgi:uncharacterized membrane protein HdeD (DUF308 family)